MSHYCQYYLNSHLDYWLQHCCFVMFISLFFSFFYIAENKLLLVGWLVGLLQFVCTTNPHLDTQTFANHLLIRYNVTL